MKLPNIGNFILDVLENLDKTLKILNYSVDTYTEKFNNQLTNWIAAGVVLEDGNYHGIPFVINDALVLKMVNTPSTVPSMFVTGTTEAPVIVMNKLMKQQPEWVVETFMAHERGHVVLGHLSKDLGNYSEMVTKLLNEDEFLLDLEYEADDYSNSQNGKMREALIYLKQQCIVLDNRATNNRINRLEKVNELL